MEDFSKDYQDVESALKFWYNVIKADNFSSLQEVTRVFNSADYEGNDKIVFNIARKKYCLTAKLKFYTRVQIVYFRFVGTHSEYDKIKGIQNIYSKVYEKIAGF